MFISLITLIYIIKLVTGAAALWFVAHHLGNARNFKWDSRLPLATYSFGWKDIVYFILCMILCFGISLSYISILTILTKNSTGVLLFCAFAEEVTKFAAYWVSSRLIRFPKSKRPMLLLTAHVAFGFMENIAYGIVSPITVMTRWLVTVFLHFNFGMIQSTFYFRENKYINRSASAIFGLTLAGTVHFLWNFSIENQLPLVQMCILVLMIAFLIIGAKNNKENEPESIKTDQSKRFHQSKHLSRMRSRRRHRKIENPG